MTLLNHVQEARSGYSVPRLPLLIGTAVVGTVQPQLASYLARYHDIFQIVAGAVILRPQWHDYASRTAAFAQVLRGMQADSIISHLRGEFFPVVPEFAAPPLAEVDRSALVPFGLRALGVHANGYVRTPHGLAVWVARRARHLLVAPGMLDNLVGGGHGLGYTVLETLAKEGAEEAGLDASQIAQAIAVGGITNYRAVANGFRHEFIYIFDIELPASFVPQSHDNEVESFQLLPLPDILALLASSTSIFSKNPGMVLLDFALRHGYIAPDNPDYIAIVKGLRP